MATQRRPKRASPPALSVVAPDGELLPPLTLPEPTVIEATPAPPPLAEFPAASRPEGMAQRVKRLQAEARELALEHILTLAGALNEVGRLSSEIAEGGDIYPPGVRELARRMIEESGVRAQTLESLVARK